MLCRINQATNPAAQGTRTHINRIEGNPPAEPDIYTDGGVLNPRLAHFTAAGIGDMAPSKKPGPLPGPFRKLSHLPQRHKHQA